MKKVAKKTIFSVKPYLPGKPIEEVKRELGLKNVIKLASNENPFPPSPKVCEAIKRATQIINRYPQGDCYYLREALAKRLKLDSNQFIFGNGSDELIVLAVKAFVGEGDEVVLAKPSFLIYDIASRIAGAKIKEVPLQGFHYDLKKMKAAVSSKTKIVFLGNPDNPAGTYLSEVDVQNFLKGLRKDVLVFIDEAYFEFVTAKDYVNSLALLKTHKNIIVTRTFSKMYGLAGLRIGYGMANKELIDILDRIREPFNVNSLAQAAALACLKDKAHFKAVLKDYIEQKQTLYKALTKLSFEYEESFTNFILIKTKQKAADISKLLLKKGIIVRDMSVWGMNHYIRVTIGTKQENKKLLNALEDVT